jgi:hypothetical protein
LVPVKGKRKKVFIYLFISALYEEASSNSGSVVPSDWMNGL